MSKHPPLNSIAHLQAKIKLFPKISGIFCIFHHHKLGILHFIEIYQIKIRNEWRSSELIQRTYSSIKCVFFSHSHLTIASNSSRKVVPAYSAVNRSVLTTHTYTLASHMNGITYSARTHTHVNKIFFTFQHSS